MPASYSVVRVAGTRPSERRAIALLVCDEDPELDAKEVLDSLGGKAEREVRTRFDHWIEGGHNDRWFHGWPNDRRYKECFVFKWKEKRINHRLYGFLCNPRPTTNPRLRLCVLVSHATKSEWETDPSELNGAEGLRTKAPVKAAVASAFPDKKKELLH